MSESLPGVDPKRLAALAARLDASPRELLALAARLAPGSEPIDRARIDAELARIRAAGEAADGGVGILLLGFAKFAADDIDRALEIVFRSADVELR